MAKVQAKSHDRSKMSAGKVPMLAEYISRQVEIQQNMGKTQREIAAEIGYDKPNMISMFKTGVAKVPLDKIAPLARALNVDPAYVFRLAMQQYWPDDFKAISEIFGDVFNANERQIIKAIRVATNGDVPEVTPDIEKKLRAVFR